MADGEQSIGQVKAIVLLYDDNSKKWMPSGGVQGFSLVHLYENVNGSYRIVGHHCQTRQVVINFSIPKGLNYHEATPTFHQWRFKQLVYGLNFGSEEDAAVFSAAVKGALCTLDTGRFPASTAFTPCSYSCIWQLGRRVAIILSGHDDAADAVPPLYQYTGTHFTDLRRMTG
uniref:WH1 domain-containing protein n=1 Tax=Eptatretus burgeri TaxID=7764 RepID=A0A8C4X0A6_EPTBU